MRRTLLLLLTGPALAGAAVAQGLSGTALGYNVEHRVLFQGQVRERTGIWFGAEGGVALGRLRLGIAGLFGSLAGDSSAANPDVTVRASSVTLHAAVVPWLLIGVEAEARRFTADAGVTSWRLIGGNVRAAAPLGLPGLGASADLTYFASAAVVGSDDKLSPAFRATVGARYQAPRGPLSVSLGYRFERFDFEAGATGPARKEQFRGVTAGIGVRVGRR